MRYLDMCTFQIKLTNSMELKLLHSIAVKNKVDAVTFYLDSSDLYIAFESYLTGAIITHKVSAEIAAIFVRDINDNVFKTSIDNRRYVTDEIHETPSSPIETVLSGLDNKTYVRFCATTNILKAMSLYTKDYILINVDDSAVIISDSTTFLTFGKVRTFAEIEDYMSPFVGVTWDPLDLTGISTIAKALLKTRDTVYKMYIALEDNKIYSHNTYFLIEQRGPEVSGKYRLPYTTIETLKMFQTKIKAYVSKKEGTLIIASSNIFISWNLSDPDDEAENLMSILDQDNFIRIASVKREEWDKVVLLKDYSDVDSDQDVYITLENNALTATKDKNKTTIKADLTSNNLSFKVGIDSLMTARDLVGQRALLHVDSTGRDKVLVFYNEIMVVIPLSELKIKSLSNYQRYLGQMTQAMKEADRQKRINETLEGLEKGFDSKTKFEYDSDPDTEDADLYLSMLELDSDLDLDLDLDQDTTTNDSHQIPTNFNVDIPPAVFDKPPIVNISQGTTTKEDV